MQIISSVSVGTSKLSSYRHLAFPCLPAATDRLIVFARDEPSSNHPIQARKHPTLLTCHQSVVLTSYTCQLARAQLRLLRRQSESPIERSLNTERILDHLMVSCKAVNPREQLRKEHLQT